MAKKALFFAIFLCMASAALGEVTAEIRLPDGSTLSEPAEVMVGTQLSIVVASDVVAVRHLELFLEDANSDYAVLYGRDFNEDPEGPFLESYEGSCLPAAGMYAAVQDWEETGIDGLQLLTGEILIAKDNWFVVDYNVINTGDCKVVFNVYDPNGPYFDENTGLPPPGGYEPILVEHRYIEFIHVRTRDFNGDAYVDFGDFAIFASYWRETGYSDPNQCDGTDLDANGNIDVNDLMMFAGYWLEETDKRWQPGPVPTRDFNNDGFVNLGDFAVFAAYWRETGYSDPNQCEGTDLDADGSIDENDLRLLTDYWNGFSFWWWP